MPTVVFTDQLPPEVLANLIGGLLGDAVERFDVLRTRGITGLRVVPTVGGWVVEGFGPPPPVAEVGGAAEGGGG